VDKVNNSRGKRLIWKAMVGDRKTGQHEHFIGTDDDKKKKIKNDNVTGPIFPVRHETTTNEGTPKRLFQEGPITGKGIKTYAPAETTISLGIKLPRAPKTKGTSKQTVVPKQGGKGTKQKPL